MEKEEMIQELQAADNLHRGMQLEEEARASSNDIQEAFSEMLAVLKIAVDWIEYDVPIGIVDRINAAIEKAEAAQKNGGAA